MNKIWVLYFQVMRNDSLPDFLHDILYLPRMFYTLTMLQWLQTSQHYVPSKPRFVESHFSGPAFYGIPVASL